MTTPGDLQERFDRAAERLPLTPGDVGDVMARGRARRRRRQVATAAGTAVAAVIAVLTVPLLFDAPPPVSVDPVGEAPSSPAEDGGDGEATVPVLAWDHSRYGPDGVTRHTASGEATTTTVEDPVERAIGTADGGVVVQREAGAPIVAVDGDGSARELVAGGEWQRLLAVDDGVVWFTRRTDPGSGEEDEERLLSVALAGDGEPQDHGVSAGLEASTDALAFGPDGRLAWLSCHLQCRVLTGGLDALVGDTQPTELTPDHPGWYGALAYGPDGDRLAVLEGSDPVVGGTAEVTLLDPDDGRELQRVPLEVELEVRAAAVSFTPDGLTVVVGDHTRALIVTDLEGDAPRTEPMTGTGGVTLHPPQDDGASVAQPPVPAGARDVALTFAAEELGWPDAVVVELDDAATRPAGTIETAAVGLRRRPDEPMVPLHMSREVPSGPWRVTGGGHHAEGPDDPDGWSYGVQASDGVIRLDGRAPSWGGDRVTAWVLDGNEERTSSGPVEVGPDGTFESVLEVSEQRDQGVTLLLVTRAGDEVTSFVVLGIPPGEFAAG